MKRSSSSVVHDELYRAVEKGNLQVVQSLVSQGVDIHAEFDKFPYGMVIHMAAFYGHQHLLTFFLNEGLDVNTTDQDTRSTPLHFASGAGCAEVVQFLLDHNGNMHAANMFEQKPIHNAAIAGQEDVVEIFLNKGMDVQEADRSGSTLLHLSCSKGKLEVVQLLVNYKADIHAKDEDGRKPIHLAAAYGATDVVKCFLELGMSVDETDKYGQTALHLAARRGRLEVVQLLVDRITTIHAVSSVKGIGANPRLDAQDNKGNTPLHLVSHYETDVTDCLLDAGARSDIKDYDGRTVMFYFMNDCFRYFYYYNKKSILAKMRNFVDIDDQTKMTAAHLVVKDNHNMDWINIVLQKQKDLSIEDKNGETPMNYLTRHTSLSNIDRQETLIHMLVDHGAYLKVVDCERIARNRTLKERLFMDKTFCSQCLINKFDNVDLPMLGRLPSAISLSVLEKLKLKSSQIRWIELAVEEEIRNKGHCDVSKMAPPLLSILAIESYISHYRTS